MSEAELFNAIVQSLTLTFAASTWWFSATSALILACLFGGRHMPVWVFVIVVALYLLVFAATVSQVTLYSETTQYYAGRLWAWRAAHGVVQQQGAAQTDPRVGALVSYAILVLGSLGALAFSFVTWRAARK